MAPNRELVPNNAGQIIESASPAAAHAMIPTTAVAHALAAGAAAELELAVKMALAHPRDENVARGRIMKATGNPDFAEKALYKFPRGTSMIEGPSVKLAEEIAKSWRNIRWGNYTVAEDTNTVTVRGWAWDVENNIRREQDIQFRKAIQRTIGNGDAKRTVWVVPDERDLRELTQSMGSRAYRNCIIAVLPWDLVNDVKASVKETKARKVKEDPDGTRKWIVDNFPKIGVTIPELQAFLGTTLDLLEPDDLADVKSIYVAVKDKESTWSEIVGKRAEEEGLELSPKRKPPRSAVEMRQQLVEQAARQRSSTAQSSEAPPPAPPTPPG